MNKTVLDILVITVALIVGGFLSVLDNPLVAIVVFLMILGAWELAKHLPAFLERDKEENVH